MPSSMRAILRSSGLATVYLLILVVCCTGSGQSDKHSYILYIVCESADRLVKVRVSPEGARVVEQASTNLIASDISGPHGIVASPDRSALYVTLGHGRPNGSLVKFSSSDNKPVARVPLGPFPATADITPDGNFVFAVNFNLHGDMVPSSVSVVETSQMLEVARIPTCTMPHGSRISAQGTRHYSVCMMDDLLVEIDPRTFKVSRYFSLRKGSEGPALYNPSEPHSHGASSSPTCQPTWAQPSLDGARVYVACNKSDEIVEVDTNSWRLLRRWTTRHGVYNLAVNNTRLVATNKRDASISVFDLANNQEIARVPTRGTIEHGVVLSPDNRFAFVTTEGIGLAAGTLEVLDLQSLKIAASLDLPPQAAGIIFWKMEDAVRRNDDQGEIPPP